MVDQNSSLIKILEAMPEHKIIIGNVAYWEAEQRDYFYQPEKVLEIIWLLDRLSQEIMSSVPSGHYSGWTPHDLHSQVDFAGNHHHNGGLFPDYALTRMYLQDNRLSVSPLFAQGNMSLPLNAAAYELTKLGLLIPVETVKL